ncbi:MAG: LysE family translocator [Methylophaga sp.]|nr:LysE family translocator [Methylophaga sp.]
MLPVESLIPFTVASALLAIAPGPDNIFVMTQSTLYGKRSGILITLGLCTGLIFHTSVVALGVATLLQTSSWAFVFLRTLGAGYLLYLAWQTLSRPLPTLESDETALSDKALYLRGIFMNISNPKVSIFFLAFLPQFADINFGPVAPQIFLLGAIFGVVSLLIFSGIAMIAAEIGHLLRQNPMLQLYLSRLTALIFVLLALKLLFSF